MSLKRRLRSLASSSLPPLWALVFGTFEYFIEINSFLIFHADFRLAIENHLPDHLPCFCTLAVWWLHASHLQWGRREKWLYRCGNFHLNAISNKKSFSGHICRLSALPIVGCLRALCDALLQIQFGCLRPQHHSSLPLLWRNRCKGHKSIGNVLMFDKIKLYYP